MPRLVSQLTFSIYSFRKTFKKKTQIWKFGAITIDHLKLEKHLRPGVACFYFII